MTAIKGYLKRHLVPGASEEWLLTAGSCAAIFVSALQLYVIRKVFSEAGWLAYKGQVFLMLSGKGAYAIMGIVAAAACALSMRRLRGEGFSWKVFCVLLCSVLLWLLPVAQDMIFTICIKKAAQHVLQPQDDMPQRMEPALEDESSDDGFKEQLSIIRARERFVKTGELIKVYERDKGSKRFEPSEAVRARRTIQAFITSSTENFRSTAVIWFCLTPLWLIAGLALPGGKNKNNL
jgi:hypothetical protein